MAVGATQSYSRLQIVLHWTVAALVIFNLLLPEGMEHAWRALSRDRPIAAEDVLMANVHVVVGIAIFLLALWRLWLRFTRGAPELPAGEHPALKLLAQVTHVLLYVLILGLPISGSLAWFFGVTQAGEAHAVAQNVLIAVTLLHVAGALAQHFVFRTNVLKRMVGVGGWSNVRPD